MDRRIGAWTAAMLVACLGLAPAARAGTYDVHACLTQAGKFTNHSWVIAVPGADFERASCSANDARPQMVIQSRADKQYAPGRAASMTFTAPAGATIADFRIHRQLFQFNPVDNAPPGSQQLYSLVQLGGTPLEGGGAYDSAVMSRLGSHGAWWGGGGAYDTGDGVVRVSSYSENAGYGANATFVRFTVGCHVQPCALMTNGAGAVGAIFAAVFGATVTVRDTTVPKVARVLGVGLTAGGVVGGDEPLTFDATDNSGIRRVELVDVTSGDPKVVGAKDLACDYTYAAPCPQLTDAQISAEGLAGGMRTLKLRLIDAGSNVGESEPLVVNNGGPLNGAPASAAARLTASFARNRRGRINVGFGRRASVRGRLTDATGKPIAGATVQVLDRELRTGTRYAQRLEVTTDGSGRFSVLPGPGAARAIRFEYRSRRLLAAPDAADTVELRVAAASTLRISPTRVRPRGSIRISGRLRGTPLPRSGKVVDLQAYEHGTWRTFDTVRARRQARFSTRYRFLRAGSGASFLIRARIRREDAYPYYLGYSPPVRVRVR